MPSYNSDDELVEGIADLSLISKEQLAAELARMKRKYRELEKDFSELDNDKRSFEAEVNELDKENDELKEENSALKKEIDGWKDCFDILETAKAGESSKAEEDTMEIDEVEEKEEEVIVCKYWARRGLCRDGFEGDFCQHGYHPPKDDSKVTSTAEVEEEVTL